MTSIPDVTALPTVPSVNDSTFETDAQAFLEALRSPFVGELNAVIAAVNAAIIGDGRTITAIDNTDSPYDAANGEIILADTTSGTIQVNLPSGGYVDIIDKATKFSTNNLTVSGNGNNIDGAATMVLSYDNTHGKFAFVSGDQWYATNVQTKFPWITNSWTQADGKYIATDEIRAKDADGLKLYDDGGNGIFVKDGGKVGIGTASPKMLLDVANDGGLANHAGSFFLMGNLYNDGSWKLSDTGYGMAIEQNKAVGKTIFYGTTNGAANDGKSVSTIMVVSNNGNVGIGTASPTNLLSVGSNMIGLASDYSSGQINFNMYYDGSHRLSNAGYGAKIDFSDADGGITFYQTTGGAGTAGQTKSIGYSLYLSNSGNVGIGTVSPSANAKLDVDGVAKVKSYTVATVPTAVAGGIIYVSDETGGAVLAFSDGTNWRRVTDRAVVS